MILEAPLAHWQRLLQPHALGRPPPVWLQDVSLFDYQGSARCHEMFWGIFIRANEEIHFIRNGLMLGDRDGLLRNVVFSDTRCCCRKAKKTLTPRLPTWPSQRVHPFP